MLLYLIVGLACTSVGLAAGLCIGRGINARLVQRLTSRNGLLEAARELENRRLATESGRETLVRARAGKASREIDGMAIRPGTLARYHDSY